MAATKDIRLLVKAEVEKAIKDLNRAEKELTDLDKSAVSGTSAFGGLKNSVAGFVSALAVQQVAQFAIETAKLAGKAEDLRRSLKNLADKEGVNTIALMSDLRSATSNTVTDIDLMKAATQGKFLGVDLKNMPILFEFAARRAKDTGQEIDYLVDSIVTGIGRRSPQILDNLGIQMRDLDAKIEEIAKGTGQWNGKVDENLRKLYLQEAAVKLAKEQIAASGEQSITAADKLQQLNVQWENLKIVLGELVSGPLGTAIGFLTTMIEVLSGSDTSKIKLLTAEISRLDKQIKDLESGNVSFWDDPFPEKSLERAKKRLEQVNAELKDLLDIQRGLAGGGAGRSWGDDNNDSVGGTGGSGGDASFFFEQRLKDLLKDIPEEAIRASESLRELKASLDDLQPVDGEAELAEADRIARIREEYENYLVVVDHSRELFRSLEAAAVDAALNTGESWTAMLSTLKKEIARFLVSQIFRTFLNFFFGAIFPGASLPFGKTLFSAIGGGTSSNPVVTAVGAGAGRNLTGATGIIGGLPKLMAPQPLPATGGGFITKQSYIEKTTPVSGRIIVETIAPEMTRVKQYHIDVEDRIAEPHRNRKQRQRRDGTDGIWK